MVVVFVVVVVAGLLLLSGCHLSVIHRRVSPRGVAVFRVLVVLPFGGIMLIYIASSALSAAACREAIRRLLPSKSPAPFGDASTICVNFAMLVCIAAHPPSTLLA